jgi:hypothetical protein
MPPICQCGGNREEQARRQRAVAPDEERVEPGERRVGRDPGNRVARVDTDERATSIPTLTTILPTARTTLSMAAHKAIPERFARVSPRFQTPTWSTPSGPAG